MNREEAIETLKANYPDTCFEQLRDAVDTAISALKQPEIIHCKECIYWERNYYQDIETCFEHRNVDGTEQSTPPDYYCASARRREK